MRQLNLIKKLGVLIFCFGLLMFNQACHQPKSGNDQEAVISPENEGEEGDKYDGPDKIAELEIERTKDPSTGIVPRYKYMAALQKTIESRTNSPLSVSAFGTWTERGPVSDLPGPSNGNTRGNNDYASGRIRAILVDAADATGNTVFVGSVSGGLWKTTSITSRPAGWTLVNDFLSNLAITGICQDPTNSNTMYFCTGEAFGNIDAVNGNGVFKSTDHGVTWTQLASTATYTSCTKIECDASGNVYLGTFSNGFLRSTNGGSTWTSIGPSGFSSRVGDFVISSTGRLHLCVGLGNSTIGTYRFTDNPSTVTSATWTAATTPFPYPSGANCRVKLGCLGNVLYALPSNTSAQVATIYKSSDGGNTWAATAGQPTAGWASGQAWYALGIDIDPTSSNNVIVGGLDSYKSTDGGATWAKNSIWVNNPVSPLPYVHADIHIIKWYDNGNKLLYGCDGGIHYSDDKGVTIRDRNEGLRIKQFYSCAAHPTTTNYFLAGAQDNGCHQFNNAGLSNTVEITGGDGAYVAIDQNQAQYQFGSYVYNRYRRSTNSGSSWGSVNFLKGTSASPVDFGSFINPFAYDNALNVMYCSSSSGEFFRWTDPQTLASGTYYQGGSPSWPATAGTVAIPEIVGAVSAVSVSPYTSDRVYFGTSAGRVVRVDNASTIASGSSGTNISTGLPAGNISCISQGTDDNNLICCLSNYGIASVWKSTDGGTTWSSLDNNGVNLPDMPVRWCMFVPGSNNTQAVLATETGVWLTQAINGTSTVWLASPTFPIVRTDMLAYRASDNILVAATHGRGLWTQNIFTVIPVNNFTLRGKWATGSSVELNWDYPASTAGAAKLDIESSPDGVNFTRIGSMPQQASGSYKFVYGPPAGAANLFYRIKSNEITGAVKYSNTIKLFRNGNDGKLEIIKLYPNPVQSNLGVAFNIASKGAGTFSVTTMNGQELWRKQEDLQFSGNYIRNWDISSIKPGSYIFTLTCNGEKVSQRFIKQ